MCVVIDKQTFVADAVFVPDAAVWKDNRGHHADPDNCLKLMVVGDNNSAEVFTQKAWESDSQPFCRRENGKFTHVVGGVIELLPELWVVKIDERSHDVVEEAKEGHYASSL